MSLADAYARIERGEAWLVGAAHRPVGGRRRALQPRAEARRGSCSSTAHEIDQLLGKTKAKGLTLVPLRLYINDAGKAKLELGLAKGKQTWDRRREIAERDARRDIEREVADAQGGAARRRQAPTEDRCGSRG